MVLHLYADLYADDTHLKFPVMRNNKYSLNELRLWLSSNFLHLNENKSKIILFGSKENVFFFSFFFTWIPYSIYTQYARN